MPHGESAKLGSASSHTVIRAVRRVMMVRMKGVMLLLALGGCDAVFGLDAPKLHDASGGGGADASCAKIGKYGEGGAGWFLTCVPADTDDVVLDLPIVDTSIDARCGDDPMQCTIVARTLTIPSDVQVVGNRPLVLVAAVSITIDAVLDVSSSRDPAGQVPGPGAGEVVACMDIPSGESSTTGGGAGGAGASWQTQGGDGGSGKTGVITSPLSATLHPSTLRAGCQGGTSGTAKNIGATVGGFGGGAIYLAAPVITLGTGGAIEARGNGGDGGGGLVMGSGGGGGGAGGLIVLDTMSFALPIGSGALNANGGGGGGGGGGGSSGGAGLQSLAPALPGSGGSAAGGATGGIGGADNADGQPGTDASAADGGGGGGGGEGFILLFSAGTTHAPDPLRISPDLTVP
jgi:hypothetical protein